MTTSLFTVISTILNIKRWNTMPQIEIWTEAENIAYYTHMAYAIAKEGYNPNIDTLNILLDRCLLKSLNKHYLSDISISSRDKLKELDPNVWEYLVDEAALKISKDFPRNISKDMADFMSSYGDYEIKDEKMSKEILENLIKYCQYKTALEECEINMSVFKTENYKKIHKSINSKIYLIPPEQLDILESTHLRLSKNRYFETIKQLKNLLRWNRVVRSNESSVMAHTFVVGLLALVFSKIEARDMTEKADFEYASIIRALFHDLPESLTGDIISPVKEIINKKKKHIWRDVEKEITSEFNKTLPLNIQKDFKKYNLLEDFSDELNSVDSLVKSCDQIALIFECIFERDRGSNIEEMENAYKNYISRLQNSEWNSVREYAHCILIEFPK